ncbi:sigma-54 interaction domain-containing protein [Enterococcus sp. AZ109]|uniref:sigma-54 interaction domain-containing protein n=1 Tax=Enterococcus sp. AZ109 TaxID=2774634 RepID=UPI003F234DBB
MIIDEKCKMIFDSFYDPILVINTESIVTYVNAAYLEMTGLKYKDILNRKLSNVRYKSRLSETLKTGNPILHLKRKEGDVEYFTNLLPIIDQGEVLGALSLSTRMDDVRELMNKLKKSEIKINQLKDQIKTIYSAKYTFDSIIGAKSSLREVAEFCQKVSSTQSPISIYGESGTGKELFAQAIHNESDRKNKAFIPVNSATLNNDLFESELFGYEAGSFTGGNPNGKKGLIIEASEGTLFLDEIGEMGLEAQAKLLRVLQEKKIRPIGSNREYEVNTRFIFATNRNLEKMIEEKRFREDLFYRISVFGISIPPLRKRDEDILELANHFLAQYNTKAVFSQSFVKFLMNYEWPGNVRELKNVIEYSSAMSNGDVLELDDLPRYLANSKLELTENQHLKLSDLVKEYEKKIIQTRLNTGFDTTESKQKIAKELGISLATLYNKLNR